MGIATVMKAPRDELPSDTRACDFGHIPYSEEYCGAGSADVFARTSSFEFHPTCPTCLVILDAALEGKDIGPEIRKAKP